MEFKNVTVAGSGVLGYQIAFQTAFRGFNVTVYDISDDILAKVKDKFKMLSEAYKSDIAATQAQLDATFERLQYSSDLAQAVKDADLVIEAIPEVLAIKIDFYSKLAKVAPEKTVFATNTSTLLPSEFAQATGRPEKFVALHFANQIWKKNTGEVMRHAQTSQEVFDSLLIFAKQIGMVPLAINKEQPGYILNSLLVPLLEAALTLWVKGVSDVETIDKTWMIVTGVAVAPFGEMDIIGLNTIYNVYKAAAERTQDEMKFKICEKLKAEYIDKGKLGTLTQEGFYKYPNPSYKNADFLK